MNKTRVENGGSKRQILFCGPSNKSVDLVASMYSLSNIFVVLLFNSREKLF
jgi:hypothetical protein